MNSAVSGVSVRIPRAYHCWALVLFNNGEKLNSRWLKIDDLMAVAVRLERHDFLLSHPNPVLIAAEVRNGQLLPPPVKGRNATMRHITSILPLDHERNRNPPVRFIPIRQPAQENGQPKDPWLTIGRMADADIMINDYTISKRHARLRSDRSAGTFVLEELGSTNGTWHNGAKVNSSASVALNSGDRLRFGRHIMTFISARHFYDFLVKLASPK